MKKVVMGVLGVGRIGKLHIENILQQFPLIKIKGIADPFLEESWIANKPIDYLTRNATDVLQDSDIEAILICSPTPLHAEQIIMAAHFHKHIFCEKPIAMDVKKIVEALQAVKDAKVILQIGFNRRFDPNFAKIKKMVSEQNIGLPHLLRITSRDPEIPPADYIKNSSGMFLDMTIHDFDMARFLMHSEIEQVYASGNVLINDVFKDNNDIDTAIINLKFACGCLGVIDNSRQAVYGYDQRVEVFGSLGAVHADNNRQTNTVWSTTQGIMTEKPFHFFLERYKDSYVAELQAFYQSIVENKPSMVSGKDGLFSVVVSLAAQKSLQENIPVKINYDEWNHL